MCLFVAMPLLPLPGATDPGLRAHSSTATNLISRYVISPLHTPFFASTHNAANDGEKAAVLCTRAPPPPCPLPPLWWRSSSRDQARVRVKIMLRKHPVCDILRLPRRHVDIETWATDISPRRFPAKPDYEVTGTWIVGTK